MLTRVKKIIKPIITRYRINKQLRSLVNPLYIDGFPESKNFGDALNIFLVNFLSSRSVFASRFLSCTPEKNKTSYAVIGSVCQLSRRQSVIWGAGFIDEQFKQVPFVHPAKVLAVRGPLSRAVYLENGIDCPACYGDPALLLPIIYDTPVEVTYDYGIIPHYVDWDSAWVNQYRNRKDVLIINIMIKDDYVLFVKQLKSCRRIVSSSLHGMILAHAYHIPVCAVKLSEEVQGGDFKFNDYLLSIGKQPIQRTNPQTSQLSIHVLDYDDEPISLDLTPLIASCPFINHEQKQQLMLQSESYYGKMGGERWDK